MKDAQIKFTDYSGQARIFKKKKDANAIAKECDGVVLPIGEFQTPFVIYHKDHGFIKTVRRKK